MSYIVKVIATEIIPYSQDLISYWTAIKQRILKIKKNPVGLGQLRVITGDKNNVDKTFLQKVLFKGPKCREPQSIFLKHYFKILKDSVEDYPRTWTKPKRREGTLFFKMGYGCDVAYTN